MSTQEQYVWNLIIHDNGDRREVAVDHLPFRIGTSGRADLRLDAEGVSSLHALIESRGDGLRIVDMGSRLGTKVGGARVSVSDVGVGEPIELGKARLELARRTPVAESAGTASVEGTPRSDRRGPNELARYERRYLSRPARTDGTVEVAMLVGDYVMHESLYGVGQDVTIGSGEAEIAAEAMELPRDHAFTLVHWRAGAPFLRLPAGADAALYVGAERVDLPSPKEAAGRPVVVPLTAVTRARIRFGRQTILVHQTVRPSIWRGTWTSYLAPALMSAMAVAAVLHAMAALIVAFWPAEQEPIGLASFESDETFAAIFLQDEEPTAAPEPEPEPEPEPDVVMNTGDGSRPGGSRDGGDGADAPRTDANTEASTGGYALRSPPGSVIGGPADVEHVEDRGILAVLTANPGAALGPAVTGGDAMAAINGVGMAPSMYATSGLADYYTGSGIHVASTRLALGGGPIGPGSGEGPAGLDEALTGIGESGFTEVAVATRDRDAEIHSSGAAVSGMTRDQVQRVVREHRREVRSCYEDNLRLDRGLAGRVVIDWMIGPDGAVVVAQVGSSTLESSAVEACLTRRVQQWRFPAVQGGGTVRVSYPFDFAPVGS